MPHTRTRRHEEGTRVGAQDGVHPTRYDGVLASLPGCGGSFSRGSPVVSSLRSSTTGYKVISLRLHGGQREPMQSMDQMSGT
jgi:hypothetical protein